MIRGLQRTQIDLSDWGNECTQGSISCGTIACFGGWLPFDDYFKALGVEVSLLYRFPVVRQYDLAEFEVAEYLFGDERLFMWRDTEQTVAEDEGGPSDQEIVLQRIGRRLFELGVEA